MAENSSVDTKSMGIFARFLTLWVFLAIVLGITLGFFFFPTFKMIGSLELAHINLPVALLIWVMILPMLLKVDFLSIHEVWQHRKGIAVTVGINWLVKPFSMALLGWFFLHHIFAAHLDPLQLDSYFAGLIILAAAPCTAMVFVWSKLADGDAQFTLSQVALNDAIMIFAFAPIVGLLLGVASISVPWDTLFSSVVIYILIPVVIAFFWRMYLIKNNSLDEILHTLDPFSMASLLLMIMLLFGFQGQQIVAQPLVIGMLAIPIIIQVYFTSGLAYVLNRRFGVAHCVAAPSALIGASNFFELAVATAIALFGFESGAALATVVGVLVEVPVMLSVVSIVSKSKAWYQRGEV